MRALVALAPALLLAGGARAQELLTLDQVLDAARASNARLPPARAEVQAGSQAVREARASFGPSLSVGGYVRYAPGGLSYNPAVAPINEERLQLIAQQPVYDGGTLRSRLDATQARLRSARARYRAAEKDLELEVRVRYGEILQIERELASRREGLTRLRSYLALVHLRSASGQGVRGDLMRTQVRVAGEESQAADAERRLAQAKLELNDLMGRDPAAALEVAPLPAPEPPAAADERWQLVPDLAQAEAERDAAQAGIAETRALALPHLALAFDAGVFGPGFFAPAVPTWLPDRLRADLGASVGLVLSWSFWDLGAQAARLEQARLRAWQAEGTALVARRQARLAWRRATTDLALLYRTAELRARTVPAARDAYLLAESLYRGGAGTSLEVLDAYAALVDAEVAEALAWQQVRVAAALAQRWGEP